MSEQQPDSNLDKIAKAFGVAPELVKPSPDFISTPEALGAIEEINRQEVTAAILREAAK